MLAQRTALLSLIDSIETAPLGLFLKNCLQILEHHLPLPPAGVTGVLGVLLF